MTRRLAAAMVIVATLMGCVALALGATAFLRQDDQVSRLTAAQRTLRVVQRNLAAQVLANKRLIARLRRDETRIRRAGPCRAGLTNECRRQIKAIFLNATPAELQLLAQRIIREVPRAQLRGLVGDTGPPGRRGADGRRGERGEQGPPGVVDQDQIQAAVREAMRECVQNPLTCPLALAIEIRLGN